MARLIDTSVFIELERQGLDVSALRGRLWTEAGAISCVTAAELLLGVELAESVRRKNFRAVFVASVLSDFALVPFDLPAARVYAELAARLTRTGQPIGQSDLMIAATAVAHNYGVVTHNVRHFERVPGLSVLSADG
jgi:tRNA(fMet)-specific endonuclease VapC